MIAVIDYGVGNLFSLCCSVRYLGFEVKITRDGDDLKRASHIILPGVGAFGDAATKLRATGIIPALDAEVKHGKPLIGICLGMQLLFDESSEFGSFEGLKYLRGVIRPMRDDLDGLGLDYKIPQMGWNSLRFINPGCKLLKYIKEGDFVYFVHSFYAKDCGGSVAADADYGIAVPGIVNSGNVYGTQFHPEKSGDVGLSILKAFCEL